jgi:hypothetical protein
MAVQISASHATFLEQLPNYSLPRPRPQIRKHPPLSNLRALPSDLIPIPNPHATLDITDLTLADLGGLALTDLPCDLTLEHVASTSSTSASRRQPHPLPRPPHGLDPADLGLKVVTSTLVT